ncbi:MAG: hypothetical protein JNJ46_27795 [Myxococcales bacterium]|nr:hypothetical protein [Myxococcales bacterium]
MRTGALSVGSQGQVLQAVPFAGGTLLAVLDSEATAWMALKPACAALGLDHEAQRQRLERCAWSVACVMQATGADAKRYRMYCLRADRVAMWLATLDTRRVKPALRPALQVWQCQAADALHRWAQRSQADAPPGASVQMDAHQLDLFAQQEATIRAIVRDELSAQRGHARPADSAHGIAIRGNADRERAAAFLCELVARACAAYERSVTSAEVLSCCSEPSLDNLRRCLESIGMRGTKSEPIRQLGYALRSLSRRRIPGLYLHASERTVEGVRWCAESPRTEGRHYHA